MYSRYGRERKSSVKSCLHPDTLIIVWQMVLQAVGCQTRTSTEYWEYKQSGHKGRLTVADQLFVSSRNRRGLREYRNRCLKKKVSVGPDTEVDQEYLAGLAAQKKVAFERTSCDPDQILGQLVVPVFSYQGADEKLIGVIELTTFFAKESYEEDFNQIQSLLQKESLATTYMANI
ncbi:uncharacterized protein LOC110923307 isoform X2 [Helianthus annuus]|uniref:uncharacterized protein LOC110923307 isoform X2 n=1 Tax=Helianthus annuus TaxID=4232 RepID=UPI001652E57E|nr:uncharacterized protein LOC110923307 isoform X2 [Helianthus annuus]